MASKLVLIPNATVIITSDPKASMHFEQYEKLILVEKGVELVHWLDSVPFINLSHISSIQLLCHLHAALTQDAVEQCCHWIMLSEESWEKCKVAYYDAEAEVVPHKCKHICVAPLCEESNQDSECSDDEADEPDAEVVRPLKRSCKVRVVAKENSVESVLAGQEKTKGKLKEMPKLKDTSRGKNIPLAMVSRN